MWGPGGGGGCGGAFAARGDCGGAVLVEAMAATYTLCYLRIIFHEKCTTFVTIICRNDGLSLA